MILGCYSFACFNVVWSMVVISAYVQGLMDVSIPLIMSAL
jgi:hypothetical protein